MLKQVKSLLGCAGFAKRASFALAAALVIAGIQPDNAQARSLEEAKQSGKIVVGISGDNPPYGFVDASGMQQGYDAAIARAFAKSLGVDVEFMQLTTAGRIPALGAQKVDILISGLGMTEERAKSVQFSVPYIETRFYIIAPKDTQMTEATQLSGLSVGTPRSSSIDTVLTSVAPADTDIRRFDGDSANIQALISGQVEAIAANQYAIDKIETVKPGVFENKFSIGSLWFGAASRPGEKDWNQAFNEFFLAYKATDEFRNTFKEWIKSDAPEFPSELPGISFVAP